MLTLRLAEPTDTPAIATLMERAIAQLQQAFLTPEQLAASRAVMGLDRQLVTDRTYFVVEEDGRLAGCGGWSRRRTLYGGDHSAGLRDESLLDPATDAARVRAMFTDPDFVRRGVGRLILQSCEQAAREAGFTRVELMGTMAGQPLYLAAGYAVIEHTGTPPIDGVVVPMARMGKHLD